MSRQSAAAVLACLGIAAGLVLGPGSQSAAQDEPMKGQPAAPATAGFVANKATKTYHRADCALARRLPARTRTAVADVAEAEKQGLRPCPTCKPDQPSDPASAAPMPADPAAAGGTTEPTTPEPNAISFRRDVAPVIVGNCLNCHNAKDKGRRGGLDLSSYAAMETGGKSGPVFDSDDAAKSLILLRVKGEDGPKMPPGDRRLAPETIARIEAWIADGAKLDPGVEPNSELAKIAAKPEDLRRERLKDLPADERLAQVRAAGLERWKKATSAEPTVTANARFVVFHRMPEARVKEVQKGLESAAKALQAVLGPATDRTLRGPEPISVYVFEDRNTYVEFVRSVDPDHADDPGRAHARLDVETPYLAAEDPQGSQVESSDPTTTEARRPARKGRGGSSGATDPSVRTVTGLLAEALAEAVTAQSGAGSPPRWLTLGLGSLVASSVEPQAAGYYHDLRRQGARAYAAGGTARVSELLGGQGESSAIRGLGYSLLGWMQVAQKPAFVPFVRAIREDGKKIDDVLQKGLGVRRDQFIAAWASSMDPRILQER
jgi:hypothetical protein